MSVEINVTSLIERFSDDGDLDPMDLSGSCMEHGQNAGQITWQNCLDTATDDMPLTGYILNHAQDIRDHFAEYGAWSSDEINSWADTELIAIVIQEITARYRELEHYDFDYTNESFSGSLYKCDIEDHKEFGQWFFYFGS